MKSRKEATARIKINQLLINAGWRFLDNETEKANIQLEPNVKLVQSHLDELGEDFEKVKNGFVDYLLLDEHGNPFVVLEAKSESKHPLTGKEQARNYALSLRVKYILLSNGNLHYFWNIDRGNPELITTFPSYQSLTKSKALRTDPKEISNALLDKYYIATSQDPTLSSSVIWKNGDDSKLEEYCKKNGLRVLRYYQVAAVKSVQDAIRDGKSRFLFEMATGTGKTLTAAALIKLFLRTETANRVLFLVDRIELEKQATKDLRRYLSKDGIKVAIYKENKDDWKSSEILVTTIQSLSNGNGYKEYFNPTDFDLVISDEAHRSLGSSNRAVLEYFLGYKIGLTATPKNYLKGVEFDQTDPREIERRLLLDTYSTFGCSGGSPTFSYTLNDGVKDKILVNPIIVDARTDITTQLLSNEGLIINIEDDNVEVEIHRKGEKNTKVFDERSYEKKFFSDSTNYLLSRTFIENADRDPITNEIGKSIVFCVNIEHARKVTEILNELSEQYFPGMYNSDFAVQITSNIAGSQDMTVSFANNNLNGKSKWLEGYETSKTRIAVTVGMMTTGYDCPDIINLALFRPIFSPSEFIQIKGRGTRLHDFSFGGIKVEKQHFKLFDYFAVCEYFEDKFDYDEQIKLPYMDSSEGNGDVPGSSTPIISSVLLKGVDFLRKLSSVEIEFEGMKIDRKFYQSFEQKLLDDSSVREMIKNNDELALEFYIKSRIFDKPNEYYNVKKLERSLGLDRHLTVKEIVLNIMGKQQGYKTKYEIVKHEFENFVLLNKEELEKYADIMSSIEVLFQAYILDSTIRAAVKNKQFHTFFNSPISSDIRKVKHVIIKGERILDYISQYVTANDINCERFY